MRNLIFCLALFTTLISCNKKKEVVQNEIMPKSTMGWEYADTIKNEIRSASIPVNSFNLLDFGAASDQNLIQKAIDATFKKGGGTIVIPKGIFLSGPLVLKSKINLYLEEGAIIKFIPKPEIYPLAYNWFNGIPCMNYSSMIYAKNVNDIQISGKGTIDGQGMNPVWKSMKYSEKVDWDLLRNLDKNDVNPLNRKFGLGHSLRPDLITFIECSRINISDVSIINAPFWTIHPILCENVTIKNGTINSSGYDQIGIGIESSKNVLVDNMKFQSVDDGVKILSGRVKIANNKTTENVVIQNSVFENIISSAVIFSSQTQAGANKIFLSGLKVNTSEMAFSIFANAKLNGEIHDIFIKNCQLENITGSIFLGQINNSTKKLSSSSLIYNINLDQIYAKNSGRAFVLTGHKKNNIQNVKVSNSKFSTFKGSFVKNIQVLSFSNVVENGKTFSGTHAIGDIEMPKINLERNEDEILDSNTIKTSELPENVKTILTSKYSRVPINKIKRIITKSNVIYDIALSLETSRSVDLLIQSDGKIIRSELEISYLEIPNSIFTVLDKYLKTKSSPFMFNKIKKISFTDFSYFEITGEYDNKLFALGITEDGKIIEQKQKTITTYLTPNKTTK